MAKTRNEKEVELAAFIHRMRTNEANYWWVGIFDPGNKNPDVLCTSLRGYFVKGVWIPLDDEILLGCCKELVSSAKQNLRKAKPSQNTNLMLLHHCTEEEHITKLLASRTDEQIDMEYNFMLKVALNALENINFD